MRKLTFISLTAFALAVSTVGIAGPREQARRIYQSLAGIPPSAAILDEIEKMVKDKKLQEVASKAMDEENFLRITVAQMAKAWSNKQHLIDFDLNDYAATVIGVVRDDVNAQELLTGDIVYTAADGIQVPAGNNNNLVALTPYSYTNNTHYVDFQRFRRSFKTELVKKTQSSLTGLGIAAGVMTLRGFGAAYYFAGTNRAAWENIAHVFLGKSLRAMHDTTLGAEFVRRDVDRAPGGAPLKFQSECVGCHGGMDGMSRAFAYMDWDTSRPGAEKIVYTPDAIPAKMTRNSDTYPFGNLVRDDHWVSLYQNGTNRYMGFEGPFEGDGIKSLGQFVASSAQFSRGMAHHVFVAVCNHEPTAADQRVIDTMAKEFKSSGFKMKTLFANAAIGCMGE